MAFPFEPRSIGPDKYAKAPAASVAMANIVATACADDGEQKPQVTVAFIALQEQISLLSLRLDRLTQELAPCLDQTHVSGESKDADDRPFWPGAPLAQVMVIESETVARLIKQVDYLRNSLF